MPVNTASTYFSSAFLGAPPAAPQSVVQAVCFDMETMFRQWMAQQPSSRGGAVYTEQTINDYCTALREWLQDPVFEALQIKTSFAFSEISGYLQFKADVESQSGYVGFNDAAIHGPGRLHAAMGKYQEFLQDGNVQKQIKLMKFVSPYLAAIRTKPFILLAGISGTGKSRLVRQLARGCCPGTSPLSKDKDGKEAKRPGNFEMIPVRPNWHDSTELLGYVTRITEDKKPKFVLTPFVKFLVKAWMNEDVPFFLCLDEMNLAPVEQYFAEYLSVIESRDWIDKNDHSKGIQTDVMVRFDVAQSSPGEGQQATTENFVKDTVAALLEKELASTDTAVKARAEALQLAWEKDGGIRIPANLVVMGTVNMDETTCTFSRKVLDRAMSFELNIDETMYEAANLPQESNVAYGSIGKDSTKCKLLTGNDAYQELGSDDGDKVLAYIKALNVAMKDTQFKIAYRSRNEILTYCSERTKGGIVGLKQALDEATSMKILSRIEGDDQKFSKFKLGEFLKIVVKELLRIDNASVADAGVTAFLADAGKIAASPSASKLKRMRDDLDSGAGFVSYWEC